MIADMGNVFNDSATFTPIKQWLTSEHNIREMLCMVDLRTKDLTLLCQVIIAKIQVKHFWVETSQGSTYADFNF